MDAMSDFHKDPSPTSAGCQQLLNACLCERLWSLFWLSLFEQMLLSWLILGYVVEEAFVAPSTRREVSTSFGIEISRDLINAPQVVIEAGDGGENMIDGT